MVGGQRDVAHADIDTDLRRATEDGEQLTDEALEEEPARPITVVVDEPEGNNRHPGKLYGRSLVDVSWSDITVLVILVSSKCPNSKCPNMCSTTRLSASITSRLWASTRAGPLGQEDVRGKYKEAIMSHAGVRFIGEPLTVIGSYLPFHV